MFHQKFSLMDAAGGDGAGGGGGTGDGAGGAGGAGDDGKGGAGAGDWRESLPEEIRGHKSLEAFQDVGSLAKSYVNQQPLIGADKVVLPNQDSSPEVWNDFFTKLGRPKDPNGYDFSNVLPQDTKIPDETLDGIRKFAFEAGLTKSQAQKFVKWHVESGQSELQRISDEMKKEHDEGVQKLRTEWGSALPQEVQIAKRGAEWMGGPDLVKAFDENGWGDMPEVVKAFNKLGHAIMDDTLAPGINSGGGAMTPQQAQKRIGELQTDPAYYNRGDPKHKALIDEIEELTKHAYPNESQQVAVARTPMMR